MLQISNLFESPALIIIQIRQNVKAEYASNDELTKKYELVKHSQAITRDKTGIQRRVVTSN